MSGDGFCGDATIGGKATSVAAFVQTFALAGCHDEPAAQSAKGVDLIQPLPAAWIEDTSTDPATTAARNALLSEPKIKGVFVATSGNGRSWRVAVDDDGTDRRGYAEYVCLVLREHKVPNLSEVRAVTPEGLRDLSAKNPVLGEAACVGDGKKRRRAE